MTDTTNQEVTEEQKAPVAEKPAKKAVAAPAPTPAAPEPEESFANMINHLSESAASECWDRIVGFVSQGLPAKTGLYLAVAEVEKALKGE